jgi:serine phosphatase RsbU (regulator of sigma subunit)
VGRGISSAARPKWLSLEQLCRLAPVAKATGDSLAAGVFYSPLLTAIPFLIVGCGLFPHSSVAAQNLETLYSPAPILDSGDLSAALCLLGFFGFGVPVLERMVRFRWLRWLIALPLGTAFFAYETHAVNGPLAAALTAGLCTLALFWFLYARFDLLAVLTLQFASGVVLSIFMLAQKGLGIWPLVLALGAVLATAFWFARRGSTVAEGDPLATNPALTGFRAEREKLHAEFSVARRAQQGMLPQASPDIPGYSIAGSCTPSLEVGGDLYDFLKLPDGRIGIGVADVSGKGVPAALYMTLTKGLLASVSKDKSELTSVVEEVNRHLHGETRNKVFVTMALGFLDAENRIMQCVRAGHNPVVWRQASQGVTTLVAPGGLGLGITVNRVFSSQLKMVEMRLSEGDAVVFYSDGLTEAMNSSLEQFGEERLMEAVERTDQLDAAAAHDSILRTVRTFLDGVHPQDDMTLVVLRVGR